jgi:hypothetical protein
MPAKTAIQFTQYLTITLNRREYNALGINLTDKAKLDDSLNELLQ